MWFCWYSKVQCTGAQIEKDLQNSRFTKFKCSTNKRVLKLECPKISKCIKVMPDIFWSIKFKGKVCTSTWKYISIIVQITDYLEKNSWRNVTVSVVFAEIQCHQQEDFKKCGQLCIYYWSAFHFSMGFSIIASMQAVA